MARIFISHSSEDREQAERLKKWLQSHGLVSFFLDFDEKKGIAAGTDWERTLYREISACDAVIAIVTKNSFKSKWCFVEYAQARALGKEIIPVVETPEGKTYVSTAIQHLDLVQDREGGLERLLQQLTDLAISGTGGFIWDKSRPPYPGLLAFEEADAAIYFGRGDDIRRLVERLNTRRAQGGHKMVVMLGPSGSGKSSLLRAGLLPRLKLLIHDWIVLPPFRPGVRPIDDLAQAIATGLGKSGLWRDWCATLEGDNLAHALSDLTRDLRAAHKQNEAYVVVSIDQGEELFGVSDHKQAERFFTVLNTLLDEHLPFLVVMTLRSDYFDRLQMEQHLAADFDEFSLKPMPLDRVRAIIEDPARVADIAVDEALVTAAMADARTDDALPLLAFTLRELYDRSAGSGRMTIEAYRALGDAQAQLSPLENAVRRKADEVLSAAKPGSEDLQALKEAFIPAMVRVNVEGEYVRRPAAMADLPTRASRLIDSLAKAYLLVVRQEDNVTMVEVAHEALLRKWPLLRGWLDEEREFLIGKEQLEQDLLDWQRAAPKQRPEALLWGLKLARAQVWLTAYPLQLSAAERSFIEASVKNAAQRRRARILRTAGTLVAGICLILGSVIAYQVQKKRDAMAAEAGALTFAAEEMESNQAPVSLAFLADAMRKDSSDSSAIAMAIAELRDAELPLATLRNNSGAQGDEVQDAEFSRDGSLVVTASADGAARLWNGRTGAQIGGDLVHAKTVHTAEFSPDESRIVTASYDGTAAVWNSHTGERLLTLHHAAGASVYSAHFSADGNWIVTASADKTTRVWDARTGAEIGPPLASDDTVWDAVFLPGAGMRVVSGSEDKTARIWVVSTGKGNILKQGNGGPARVSSVAVSGDGKWIAAGTDSGKVWVWNAQTLQPACKFPPQHGDGVNSVSFNPDCKNHPSLVTASRDNTARLWKLPSCEPIGDPMPHSGWVASASFSANGQWVVTASYDHSARVWSAYNAMPASPPLWHSSAIYRAHFNSQDPTLVTTASFDHTARIWRWRQSRPAITGKGVLQQACWDSSARHVLTVTDLGAQSWDARSGNQAPGILFPGAPDTVAACSPDGQWVVTASAGKAQVRSASTGQQIGAAIAIAGTPLNAEAGRGLRFDPRNRWILTVAKQEDEGGKGVVSEVQVWDIATGQPVLHAPIHPEAAHEAFVGAVFSPDGTRMATYTDQGSVRLWNLPDGSSDGQAMKHDGRVVHASFSPDGKLLVTASADHTARIWNAATGAQLGRLHMDSWVTDAEFSPDGKWIVTSCADSTAQKWDAQTFKPTGPLMRQKAEVKHAEFSPNGRWIVTFSSDGAERLWDARTGVPVNASFAGPAPDADKVSGASFSADGNWIVAFMNAATTGNGPGSWTIQFEEAPITGTLAPDWLITLAEGVGGLRVNGDGSLGPTPASEDPVLLRDKLKALPAADAVSRFGRWLASDPLTRPISPRGDQ